MSASFVFLRDFLKISSITLTESLRHNGLAKSCYFLFVLVSINCSFAGLQYLNTTTYGHVNLSFFDKQVTKLLWSHVMTYAHASLFHANATCSGNEA